MQRSLFLHIQSAVEALDPYFVQKTNAAQTLGLSSLQKIIAAMRMLTYGVAIDYVDEPPNNDDTTRLLVVGGNRGFPEMLRSIDCMHWKWKNYLTAWKRMYYGHVREPTIILEVVESYDLWIWHTVFGLRESHNDINVLERSSAFTDLADGHATPVNYSINANDYTMGYYLTDGIYPKWLTFVKTNPSPQGNMQKYFAAAQESARNDVKCAFGVLQARFAIVRRPARFGNTLKDIMRAYIIMHNIIVEDEQDVNGAEDFNYDTIDESPRAPVHQCRMSVRLNIWNSFEVSIASKTRELILNSNWTLSSTCGNDTANCRNS
ncbi:hypothetical protein HHK36_021216 [Tetracentron sinense]|uniref:Nuclease HARBI1 n=1 Tax=Tetracentron sinense TaxID=13715 RepID=A0A834YRN9_TETSI|nr:hypothetical protein HHK36_021216 [Tetracentron sinense]